MYTIALIAQKGGTGKTTITVSLATAAAQAGLTALIIDLDPQATACNWSDRRKKSYPESENPTVIDAQPARLQAVLEKVEGKVDIIFIDTPARSEQSSLAAAKVADLVLIPCRPQAYDLETIPNTREILSLAGDKPALAILNAVPSYGDRHEQAKIFLARINIPVCPITFGHRAAFGDVTADAVDRVLLLAGRALAAGVEPDRIVIDPAHDFGKNTWHSLEVTRRLGELTATGWPVLMSASRKDFVGETLGVGVDDRLAGTLAVTAVGAWLGARIFRAHDVLQTRQALDMVASVKGDRPPARTVRGLA